MVCSSNEAPVGLRRESGAGVVIMAADSVVGKREKVERFLGECGGYACMFIMLARKTERGGFQVLP